VLVFRQDLREVTMSVADKVAAIFTGPEIAKIHFTLGRLEVSPQRLRGVGKAIKKGAIGVVVAKTGGMLSAAYSPHPNRMTIPDDKLVSNTSRSGILHEGVHALVDIYKCKEVLVLDDEVAAYIAETISLKAIGARIGGGAAAMKIYKEADAVAQAHGLYKKCGVKLKLSDVDALRKAIHAHPAYSSIKASAKTSGHGLHKH
jgi:hypothetical protein